MKFDTWAIIIRNGEVYPRGALVVVGYDDSENLLVYPLGGGFELKINKLQQEDFRTVSNEEIEGAKFRESAFSLEICDGKFRGYTNGVVWNGWAKPHFPFDEAMRLLQNLAALERRYDQRQDAFVTVNDDGELEIWAAQEILLANGGHVKAYPVGAGAWCWNEL
jgi:hypothetical protein